LSPLDCGAKRARPRLRGQGLTERLASIRGVGVSVVDLTHGDNTAWDRIIETGRRCIDDGAGEKLAHHFTADEDGQKMRIYLTKACRTCPLKDQCTTANERRIKRWEHEHVVEAAQTRLDRNHPASTAGKLNLRCSKGMEQSFGP
jgi:hypothetical protein